MPFAPDTASPLCASLPWLLRLRLAAWFGLAAVLAAAWIGLHLRVPVLPMLGLAMAVLASFLTFALWRPGRHARASIIAVLAADTALLTVFLALSGGPANPFTAFYLLPVVLASVLLGGGWAFAAVALSAAGFALLFKIHLPLEVDGGPAPCCQEEQEGLSFHLYGMWLAFVVVASCVAAFMNRVARAAREREAQLAAANAKAGQFAALAALSAGAAHEIATPLGTIALAAGEMERAATGEMKEDAQLIQRETARCRAILDGMNPQARGGSADAGEALERLRARFGAGVECFPARVEAQAAVDGASLDRMLGNLAKNALDASPAGAPVRVEAQVAGDRLRLVVRDAGAGMDGPTLARAGEPFFTTKEPGAGMGLGLFVTRLLAERAGGSLTLESAPGRGTAATLELPLAASRDRGAPPPADEEAPFNEGRKPSVPPKP